MNVKNFLAAGIAGFVVNFLLGWLLWGIVFKDSFSGGTENMPFIALGCLTFALAISYIFVQWAHITNPMSGAVSGAIVALFLALYASFSANGMVAEPCINTIVLDVALTVFCGAVVGAVIAMINGKMK